MRRIWAIEVRSECQKTGYIMDNKIFERKKDAVQYRKDQGYGRYSFSSDWHIIELVRVK